MRPNLFDQLQKDRPLLLDGGLGQELLARGTDASTGLWSAQALMDDPERVTAVHRDFIDAGADVITADTYAASRRRLPDPRVFERANRVAGEAAVRAREGGDRDVLIAGSLGPIHGSYRPDRVRPEEELVPLYREQAELLADYVDLFLCETMSTAAEGRAAANGALSVGKPVWVSWTLVDDGSGHLRSGETVERAVAALEGAPVAAVLVNCAIPEGIGAAVAELAMCADSPFGGYGNGFEPIREGVDDGRSLPEARPDLDPAGYAAFAERWLEAGARIVGGCREIGPAHIAELRRRIDARRV